MLLLQTLFFVIHDFMGARFVLLFSFLFFMMVKVSNIYIHL